MTKIDIVLILVSLRIAVDVFFFIALILNKFHVRAERKARAAQEGTIGICKMCLKQTSIRCTGCHELICSKECFDEHENLHRQLSKEP